jgi:hypothetical protein
VFVAGVGSDGVGKGARWSSGTVFTAGEGLAGPGVGLGASWASASVFTAGIGSSVTAPGATWTSASAFTPGEGGDGSVQTPGAAWTSSSVFNAGTGDNGYREVLTSSIVNEVVTLSFDDIDFEIYAYSSYSAMMFERIRVLPGATNETFKIEYIAAGSGINMSGVPSGGIFLDAYIKHYGRYVNVTSMSYETNPTTLPGQNFEFDPYYDYRQTSAYGYFYLIARATSGFLTKITINVSVDTAFAYWRSAKSVLTINTV